MCGIAGIFNYKTSKQVSNGTIKKMCRTIAHRGPDNEQYLFLNDFGIGFRRLSIIDLQTGKQPISNEDNTIWVACNGEIYNYRELTENLKTKGHHFKTCSDTEVLLHAYEQWGIDYLQKLNGMFAFALYDSKQKKLFLVRDRVGIKPLFYVETPDGISFCSEIKGLVADEYIKREVNLQSLYDYFSYGYVPGPTTVFKNIYQLLPGHLMEIIPDKMDIRQYWNFSFACCKLYDDELEETIIETLKKSVKRCLISDVPVGLLLSSGVDSNAVLTLMKEELGKDSFSTFTIGYRESSYDELHVASRIAREQGIKHHGKYINAEQFVDSFEKLIWHCDNLLGDYGHVLNFQSQKFVSENDYKVALVGVGGDEMFVGYITYVADKLLRFYKMLPSVFRKDIIPAVLNILPTSFEKLSFDFKSRIFVSNAENSPAQAHYEWKTIFSNAQKEMLADDFRQTELQDSYRFYEKYYHDKNDEDVFDKFLYADAKVWMAEQLYLNDCVAMAHSVENRLPFLDHELAELAFSIPFAKKMKGFKTKFLLKKSIKAKVPPWLLKRKKQGAGCPFALWIGGQARELIESYLAPARMRKLGLNAEYVDTLISEHRGCRRNNAYKIWSILAYSKWHELYMEKTAG